MACVAVWPWLCGVVKQLAVVLKAIAAARAQAGCILQLPACALAVDLVRTGRCALGLHARSGPRVLRRLTLPVSLRWAVHSSCFIIGSARPQNFPPFCPFVYHSISEQIPAWNRSMIRFHFLTELLVILGEGGVGAVEVVTCACTAAVHHAPGMHTCTCVCTAAVHHALGMQTPGLNGAVPDGPLHSCSSNVGFMSACVQARRVCN